MSAAPRAVQRARWDSAFSNSRPNPSFACLPLKLPSSSISLLCSGVLSMLLLYVEEFNRHATHNLGEHCMTRSAAIGGLPIIFELRRIGELQHDDTRPHSSGTYTVTARGSIKTMSSLAVQFVGHPQAQLVHPARHG